MIGDDQREMFIDDGIPAFACFTGPELVDMAAGRRQCCSASRSGIRAAYWAVHGDEPATHPVATGAERARR